MCYYGVSCDECEDGMLSDEGRRRGKRGERGKEDGGMEGWREGGKGLREGGKNGQS